MRPSRAAHAAEIRKMAPDTSSSTSDDSRWKRFQAVCQSEILDVVDRAIDDRRQLAVQGVGEDTRSDGSVTR